MLIRRGRGSRRLSAHQGSPNLDPSELSNSRSSSRHHSAGSTRIGPRPCDQVRFGRTGVAVAAFERAVALTKCGAGCLFARTTQASAGPRPRDRRIPQRSTRYNRAEVEMPEEDLRAELERLKAENERLKQQRGRSVSLKVSEKGGVSVYGLGRFPVTLYKEQWARLLGMADEIRAFIAEHESELKAKPEA